MTLRSDPKRVAQMAAKLALAMLVADLAGRARVLNEIEQTSGRSFRPAKGLSFKEGRGGLDDGGLATNAAPAVFSRHTPKAKPCREATPGAGQADRGLPGMLAFAEGDAVVLAPEKLEPKAALDFFRVKVAMARPAFNKLAKRYRDTAFTVANVESVKLIEEIQGELDNAIANGLTQAQFTKAVDALFRSRGLQPLDPFHLETVFRTNVASAYSAGRAHQMLDPAVRRALPWWEYRTVGDSRVRDEHAAIDGFIAKWNDPVWSKITPPNGYNCRCKVVALLDSDARERARKSGQDLDVPGIDRLPADAHIDFDNSPPAELAARAAGKAPQRNAKPSAKEITAKAKRLRKVFEEDYLALERKAEAAQKALAEAQLREMAARGKSIHAKAAAEYSARKQERDEARMKFRGKKAEFDAALHRLVRPARQRVYELAEGVERKSIWERGLREFGRLVGVGPEKASIKVRFGADEEHRSEFSRKNDELVMASNAGTRTVVHEMGHWLETHDEAVARAARAFLARRTKGEEARRLRDLVDPRYLPDEMAKPDEFLNVYMGKVYKGGQTEIVSVGAEWLFAQPFDLLADEDYFEFLIAVLHGEEL